MAASRGVAREVAREAQGKQVVLERMTEIAATQPSVEEGYIANPEITEAIKRLPGYLHLVVTLMAMIVPSSEESKIRKKKGREELAQATNMVLIVSILVHLDLHQMTIDRLSNDSFIFLSRAP